MEVYGRLELCWDSESVNEEADFPAKRAANFLVPERERERESSESQQTW